jgi:UDP-glucose 4-epimerase
MRTVVTGGCGYIGSALIPRLRAADAVEECVVLDTLSTGSPRALMGELDGDVAFHNGDVREFGDVEHVVRDADTVIHLAAITGAASTHDREAETEAVNYDGTENVLRAARKFDVENVVFASSCNVYGRAPTTDLDETTDPDPINPYAETKLRAEALLETYVEDYGLDGTALRMSTNFGEAPGVRFNLVVNYFVFRALTDRALTVYGDGRNWRPFIHVQDAARAYAAAALDPDAWPQLRYNVGSDAENYRIEDVADIVREEAGPVDVTYLEEEHPGPSYHVAFDRLAETGFEPQWTLREGVRSLVDRFRGTDGDAGPTAEEEENEEDP